ncbi:hypothetical protein MPC1_4840004 [Methylocella tundrae]|nr:hypothetical protein MPC1_4840004 [Methylocella tundrae]
MRAPAYVNGARSGFARLQPIRLISAMGRNPLRGVNDTLFGRQLPFLRSGADRDLRERVENRHRTATGRFTVGKVSRHQFVRDNTVPHSRKRNAAAGIGGDHGIFGR